MSSLGEYSCFTKAGSPIPIRLNNPAIDYPGTGVYRIAIIYPVIAVAGGGNRSRRCLVDNYQKTSF